MSHRLRCPSEESVGGYETEPVHCTACSRRRLVEVIPFVAFQTRTVVDPYNDFPTPSVEPASQALW